MSNVRRIRYRREGKAKMKIERSPGFRIKVIESDTVSIVSETVEANILYEMLQELKQIKRHLTGREGQLSAFSDPGDEF